MTSGPTQIGPYLIERELGRGGMGVVYLARDPRLDRHVAIKALPESLAADSDRLARFEREARVLASLNHPGIGAIHGLEEVAGHRFLVLEYIEGETLAERLKRGPIPIDEAIALAVSIAGALEAAHEKGVVHRDLKPGNVMVSDEGVVKVLDFGLARTADGAPSSTGHSPAMTQTPTLTTPVHAHSPTIPGAIMGSAGYMSPEQARGKPVDKRSDIFSFGCVFYEMLTGAQPFMGETAAESIGAVMHKDADLGLLPPTTPPMVRHVLRRCLERDRHQRFRDIGDVRIELERSAAGAPDSPAGAPRPSAGAARILAWSALALLLGSAGTYLALSAGSKQAPERPVITSIDPALGSTIVVAGDLSGPAVISPDGTQVTFTARDASGAQALWLRPLDRAEPESLKGTERATFPFWSPDSRSIGFFSDGKLRRIDLGTRTTRTLCDAPGGRGGAWLDGGTIIFSPGFQTGLERIPADGGQPQPLTAVDPARFTSHRWPTAIRGTDRFIYLAVSHDPAMREQISIFLGSLDGARNTEVIHTPFSAQVVGDRLLFLRENKIFAAPFDSLTGSLGAEPVPVLEGVDGDLSTWRAAFSVSNAGALIFHPVPPPSSDAAVKPEPGLGESTRAMIIGRDGRPGAFIADGMLQNAFAVSPDGLSLAVSGRWPNETSAASFDIWIFTMFGPGTDWAAHKWEPVTAAAAPRRFTFLQGDEVAPAWSPDGKSIAFGKVFGAEPLGVFIKPLDGGTERLLLRSSPGGPQQFPTGWSRDGRYLICKRGSFIATGAGDVLAVPVDGGDPIELLAGPAEESGGTVSNDNKWLAFDTTESGVVEVFVVPFPPGWEADRAAGRPVPDPGQRYRISLAGGAQPIWSPTGSSLFYASSSDSIIEVRWSTEGARFSFDAGRALFDFPLEAGVFFDVIPSAEYFVVSHSQPPRPAELRLVLNWTSLLPR